MPSLGATSRALVAVGGVGSGTLGTALRVYAAGCSPRDSSAKRTLAMSAPRAPPHSLSPILAWQSLLWFEVAEIDEKGGVVTYSSRHLTPSERIQGETPPDQLYARTIADGREVIELMRRAMLALAELLTVAGKLEPPPVLGRVMQTGEVFFDRAEASQAARAASG